MHYYQFNIGDYAKHTRHLTNLEDLAYRRLIDLYYDTECPLIRDVKKLARLINMRENEQEIQNVLGDFFILDGDSFSQKRIDREITNYHSKADTARDNGKKGGRPKKPKPNPEETQPVNSANPEETQKEPKPNPEETGSKANQEPVTSNHQPSTSNQELSSSKDLSPKADDPAMEIFEFWKITMSKSNQTIFTKERKKRVADRLKEGYTVEQIKSAIQGCSVTPHNNGTDPDGNGQRYDDLELICRTGGNVERFASKLTSAQPERQRYGAHVAKTLEVLDNLDWDPNECAN